MLRGCANRGDTIIEVLFAIAAFSALMVGSLSLMNKGLATAQRSLEVTLVRNEIDSQADTLRFLSASYVARYIDGGDSNYYSGTPALQWFQINGLIVNTGAVRASDFGATGTTCPTPPSGSFILNTKKAVFVSPSSGVLSQSNTYSQLVYDANDDVVSAQGLWIEGVRSANSLNSTESSIGYIDFHIRACWIGTGQNMPMTIGTIVRLYEPR